MLGPILVHQAADRAAGRVIHASHTTGADGDEFLLGDGNRADNGGAERQGGGNQGQFLHCWSLSCDESASNVDTGR